MDAIDHAKILEEVGFSRKQAETSARTVKEVVEYNTVSKQDLKIAIGELRSEFKQDMKDLEVRLTIRMGVMQVAASTLMIAILKLT